MSNEKPKPIIIKSNKCEDTLPSPITKETDWDDTKELTNQELKEIYEQAKEETKLKNWPVNIGIITPIENEIEIFSKPKKPSYIVFFLLVIFPLLFFLFEESINYNYDENYVFTNNPNSVDFYLSPSVDWKIINFNTYYHGNTHQSEEFEPGYNLYEIKIEDSQLDQKFLNIINPGNREMNLTPKTIDGADSISISIVTQFRDEDGNVTYGGELFVNCGNGLNGDCNEHGSNWIYLYDLPDINGFPSPYGSVCNCGGEEFENSIMLLLADGFEPTEMFIHINYRKDVFVTLFSCLCLPIIGIPFYLITKI